MTELVRLSSLQRRVVSALLTRGPLARAELTELLDVSRSRLSPEVSHLIAKKEMLPCDVVSHTQRLGLAGLSKRANGGGGVVANDGQNGPPQIPGLRFKRLGEVCGAGSGISQSRQPDVCCHHSRVGPHGLLRR